jgi:hypothetical protein
MPARSGVSMSREPTVRQPDRAVEQAFGPAVREESFVLDLDPSATVRPAPMRPLPFAFHRSDHAAERLVAGDIRI